MTGPPLREPSRKPFREPSWKPSEPSCRTIVENFVREARLGKLRGFNGSRNSRKYATNWHWIRNLQYVRRGHFFLFSGWDTRPTPRWSPPWSLNFANRRRNARNFSEASITAHFSIRDISVRCSLKLQDRFHHNPALRILGVSVFGVLGVLGIFGVLGSIRDLQRELKSLLRGILHPNSTSSTSLFAEIRFRVVGRLRKQLSTTVGAGSRASNPELSRGRCIQGEIRSHFYWRRQRRLFSCVRQVANTARSRDWPICTESVRVSLRSSFSVFRPSVSDLRNRL